MSERRNLSEGRKPANPPPFDTKDGLFHESRSVAAKVEGGPEIALKRVNAGLDTAKIQLDGLGKALATMMLKQSRGSESPALSGIAGESPDRRPAAVSGDRPVDVPAEGQTITTRLDPLGVLKGHQMPIGPGPAEKIWSEIDPGQTAGDGLHNRPAPSVGFNRLGEESSVRRPLSSMDEITSMPARGVGVAAESSSGPLAPVLPDGIPSLVLGGSILSTPDDVPPAQSAGLSYLAEMAERIGVVPGRSI